MLELKCYRVEYKPSHSKEGWKGFFILDTNRILDTVQKTKNLFYSLSSDN